MGSNKIESLKRKSDFLEIKKAGKRVRLNNWLLFNFKKNDINKLRLGMTIPKKVGVAVMRNRLKRWCRECLKKDEQLCVLGVDINVVFLGTDKKFFKELRFGSFKEAFDQGLLRLRRSL